VKTSVERVDDTTVKLSITIEPERVGEAVEAAARRLASEVKVPGFRPGRVPRRVLEKRLGTDVLLQEAAREALPGFYSDAVQAEELPVVSPPEFDLDTFTEADGAIFTATVEVRPEFDVPDFSELQVAHPDWELTEEEVTEQLDMLRERFAELEVVERPAEVGDYLVITVEGVRDGERMEEASGEDLLYELKDAEESDSELDRQLIGAEAGQTITFTDTLGEDYGELAGVEVDFTAEVKEVKSKSLPEVDDDFAITATEFDTAEELMSELRTQLGAHKRMNARAELRGKVVEAVADLVEVALPPAMVNEELQFRLQRLGRQAEQYGLSLEQFIQMSGTAPDELFANLESEARKTVKAQLVIDRIGQEASIEVTQEDLGIEISRQAQRLGRDPQELAGFMTHPDRISALVSDAFRRKSIDHILETVAVLSAPPDEPEESLITDGGEAVEGHDAAAAIARAQDEAATESDEPESDEPDEVDTGSGGAGTDSTEA
jgi:trigger factor